MSIALTRSDLLAFQASLPKRSRGQKILRRLVQQLTCAELRFELEIERALMAGIKRDPEYREARHG